MANIYIVSYYDSRVILSYPILRFRKEWLAPNNRHSVPQEVLEEIIYEPGVDYMFRHGMLGFENPEDAEKVGFSATGEYTIFTYNEMEDMIKEANRDHRILDGVLSEMSETQLEVLARIAIAQKIGNYDLMEMLRKASGINVESAIRLKVQMEREDREAAN